ncbi:MAG: hypothetical protein AAF500_07730 [Myxococcota bacterium]
MSFMRSGLAFAVVLPVFVALAASGCKKKIPNTTVDDTPANRGIINFMENYRRAVEERDVGALLAMAHPQYLDDNGTPTGDDDIDYRALRIKLASWRERVTDVRYEIKYRTVGGEMDRIMVDYRYSASFRIAYAEEDERWSRRIGENRMVLLYDDIEGRYYVLSGM